MYVDISKLGQGISIILALIILILITIVFLKLIKAISSVNLIINNNKTNINKILSTLSKTSENLCEITDYVKNVTKVIDKATNNITQ